MTAHDPRATLTEAGRPYVFAEKLWTAIVDVRDAAPRVANDADTDDIVSAILPLIHAETDKQVAACLAPIRALADDAAALYDDRLAEVAALPPGSVGRRLHSMLGDLAHAALSAPVSASQDHDGAEGRPWFAACCHGPVHDHPPYEPTCNERRVDGQLRGACLNDDGSPR